MSELSEDEFETINQALSHASVYEPKTYQNIALHVESALLAVARGNLIDPVTAAAEDLREAYAMAVKFCTCPPEFDSALR